MWKTNHMEKWRNKSPHDINIVVAKEKTKIQCTLDDHHVYTDSFSSQSNWKLWKDPQRWTSSSVESQHILGDKHKLWGAQSLPSSGRHEANRHTFIQESARYCLIIGVYYNLEKHIRWKAESSEVTPIEGNNKTTWWGYRMITPMLYNDRRRTLLISWDRRVILSLRRIWQDKKNMRSMIIMLFWNRVNNWWKTKPTLVSTNSWLGIDIIQLGSRSAGWTRDESKSISLSTERGS